MEKINITAFSVTRNGEPPHSIRVRDELYEWLAKSEFSQLGRSRNTQSILGKTRALIHDPESPMTQAQWQDKTTRLKTL